MENNVPVMSADPSSAESFDVLAAWGFDYYKMGVATGRLIDEIIKGKKTEDIPVQYMTDPSDLDLLINLDVAKSINLTVPQEILDMATLVVENGTLKKK
jgi:putative ABC transport system substrate-binding protein